MFLDEFANVCREELLKAQRALLAAYELMRAADQRAIETLWLFFRDR
jgi:hypothetical protein